MFQKLKPENVWQPHKWRIKHGCTESKLLSITFTEMNELNKQPRAPIHLLKSPLSPRGTLKWPLLPNPLLIPVIPCLSLSVLLLLHPPPPPPTVSPLCSQLITKARRRSKLAPLLRSHTPRPHQRANTGRSVKAGHPHSHQHMPRRREIAALPTTNDGQFPHMGESDTRF